MENITTPFGRRTLSFGMVAAQVVARDVEGKVAHKWKTFRAIAECKDVIGISDRSLVVLNALLTCLPETALSAGDLIVFPSNRALSVRSHGMAETTLRRHLAALIQVGLIVRRDSPNGKRYAHRGEQGVEQAFGFDLSPVLARVEEFERLAAEVAAERRQAAMARERVTIYRRDIGKMLEAANMATGIWTGFRDAFLRLCYRLPRKVSTESVGPLVAALRALSVEVGTALEEMIKTQNMDGNGIQNGAHIENSKPGAIIESEPVFREEKGARSEQALPLAIVLRACPDIAMYDQSGMTTWRDLIATAGTVRGMLGISASAWETARQTMGDQVAAATVAGILQRAEAITSPGGYLRGLTEKSRAGQFSPWPMMLALIRAGDQSSPYSKSNSNLSGSSGGGS